MKKLQLIKNAKKIVIKIGSSLLIDNGKFNYRWLKSFVEDLDSFLNKTQIIIVASGAVKSINTLESWNIDEGSALISLLILLFPVIIIVTNVAFFINEFH